MFSTFIQKRTNTYKPFFYDIKKNKEKKELTALLEKKESLEVLDEIESQLKELIKLKYPQKKLSEEESKDLIKNHLGEMSLEEYGVWVYYPWLNKVIHLLPEEEFIEVRTNRNHYKITPKEESILAKKKIGIIGLSVGKSIALTIALERVCGELVLADFDEIELSNLNRIQTGVQNFGVKKTVVVAREISEIDPYLKVTCLHDGLTEENANVFFLEGGKLDVCIEVCDGLYTKIFSRQKAKEYGIPVVMNSSDRGTTDIERYDLDPNLPILHGLIDHLDLSLLKEAKTNEEKVPYLLPMLGVETSSNRLKASMLEINETITTWPQLASGVIFGGGICTDVCRRLLLKQITKSGRYFVDVEEIINDKVGDYFSNKKNEIDRFTLILETKKKDYQNEIDNYNKFHSDFCSNDVLTKIEVEELVEHAIMAPSGGNIQPWKWIYTDGKLFLFNDKNRSKTILNYNNNANLVGLGAATENLILKAHELNIKVHFDKLPYLKDEVLIAVFYFTKDAEISVKDDLVNYIPLRATNRILSKKGESLSEAQLTSLKKSIINIEGAELRVYQNKQELLKIQDILIELDRVYLTSKKGHHHFISEIRWGKREIELSKDGVDINTIDLTPTEKAGLIVSKEWDVVKHSKEWDLGKTFGKLTKKAIDSSAALAMIVLPKSNSHRFFEGGRALERIWLTATKENIGMQPISINAFLFERILENDFSGIEELEIKLKELAAQFYKVCAIKETEQNVFFFRLFRGSKPKVGSLRRELEKVMIYEED